MYPGSIHVFYFKAATQVLHPFSHIDESVTVWPGVICVKTAAIIFYYYAQSLFYIETDKSMLRSCMFYNIMQGFFYSEVDIPPELPGNKCSWKFIGCLHRDANTILSEIIHGVCPCICQQIN